MLAIIVGMEGFKLTNGQFIVKEFAYVNTNNGQSMCYFIIAPASYYKYTESEGKIINWLTKHFHKINLDFGFTKFEDIKIIFNSLSNTSDTLFLVKGKDKCTFLSTLTGKKILNLEDYGCPKFEHLSYPNTYCGFDKHHNTNHCALKKASSYAKWYNESDK